jgi:hypothetical protein
MTAKRRLKMMKKLALIAFAVVFVSTVGLGSVHAADTIKIGFNAP